jgi:hypothetical protein
MISDDVFVVEFIKTKIKKNLHPCTTPTFMTQKEDDER